MRPTPNIAAITKTPPSRRPPSFHGKSSQPRGERRLNCPHFSAFRLFGLSSRSPVTAGLGPVPGAPGLPSPRFPSVSSPSIPGSRSPVPRPLSRSLGPGPLSGLPVTLRPRNRRRDGNPRQDGDREIRDGDATGIGAGAGLDGEGRRWGPTSWSDLHSRMAVHKSNVRSKTDGARPSRLGHRGRPLLRSLQPTSPSDLFYTPTLNPRPAEPASTASIPETDACAHSPPPQHDRCPVRYAPPWWQDCSDNTCPGGYWANSGEPC